MTHTATTIDPQEVAFYERLADTWWDETGPFWPLHKLNALRTGWLRDRLCEHFGRDASAATPLSGLRVLDIGCGGGILSFSMAELGASVHGIDVTERNIRVAQRHLQLSGVAATSQPTLLDLRFESVSAEELTVRPDRYDAVLSMEVVEHVADLPTFVRSCCRLVAPKGLLFMSTINRTLRSWLFAIVGAEYVLRWLPRGTHQWRRFPKPSELERLLRRDSFAVGDQTGVAVNPFTRRFRLIDDLKVNYMLVAQRR